MEDADMFTETCERRSTLMTPVPLALLIAFVGLLWGCTDPVEPVEEEAAAMIVFTINPPGVHEFEGRDVFVIRADGTDETRLTTGRGAFDASWSPDGTRIVFASAPEFGGDGHLYVMDANGSGVRAITSGPGSYSSPTWSPDGDRILFVRTGDPMSLNVVDADGSNPTTVVECPHTCRWPAWSPDGATVAVVLWAPITSPLHFSPVIYLVDLGDPEFRPLPGGFDYGHMPAWTPAGSLLLLGQRDGQAHAFYLATPGGQVLERIDLEGATGSSPSLLPDGRILYFELGTPSRIILLDRSTGEASVVREWADARTTFATPRFRP